MLEDRITTPIVFERKQVEKMDEVSGAGNRSAYVRYLVDTADGNLAKRFLDQEEKIKILKQVLAEKEKEVLKRDMMLEVLRGKINNKEIEEEEAGGELTTLMLEEVKGEYQAWRKELELRNIPAGLGRELDWVKLRARDLHMVPKEVLVMLHEAMPL